MKKLISLISTNDKSGKEVVRQVVDAFKRYEKTEREANKENERLNKRD